MRAAPTRCSAPTIRPTRDRANTVDVARACTMIPLIDHGAVPWVRSRGCALRAAQQQRSRGIAKAKALLDRVDALEDPAALARYADEDAQGELSRSIRTMRTPNCCSKSRQIGAGGCSRTIRHGAGSALQRAAQPGFPIANLPTTWGPAFVQLVEEAANGGEAYSTDDQTNAEAIVTRLKASRHSRRSGT